MKLFNTGGVCHPDKHYMLPARQRFVDEGISVNVERLIQRESYFVIHAPRQVGKTTAMRELAKELVASGKYIAVLVSMEVGYGLKGDLGAAELAILNAWRSTIELQLPSGCQLPQWPDAPPGNRIGMALTALTKAVPLPLVVFLDEIDALQDDVLVSVIRQLQTGHILRPDAFPISLAIVGSRMLRGAFSMFDVAVRSLRLRHFNVEDVRALLEQHTSETGQAFTEEAIALIHELTQGQPQLVNMLAKICVEDLVTNTAQSIQAKHVQQALVIFLQHHQLHFATLFDKSCEARLRRVIEPMLAGNILQNLQYDDLDYAIDLGLVRRERFKGLVIANPIYHDVVPRVLAGTA